MTKVKTRRRKFVDEDRGEDGGNDEEEEFVDEDRGEDGGNDEEEKEREHRVARMDPGSTTLEKTKQYASVQQSSLEEGVAGNGGSARKRKTGPRSRAPSNSRRRVWTVWKTFER